MMRFIFSMALIIVATGLSFSQTTLQLDNKYGFKHFELNTHPLKYKTEIDKVTSWDPNSKVTQYEYSGNDISSLFGVFVSKVSLTYYDNKLESIQVTFGDTEKSFTEDEYERVLYSLQKLYGQGNPIDLSHPEFTLLGGRKWIGKKVTMELLRLFYKPDGSTGGYIQVTENALHKKRISDDF